MPFLPLLLALFLQLPLQTWVCPMHPDVRAEEEKTCPLCGMALVAWKPDTYEPFVLDASAKVQGKQIGLSFAVHHPVTKALVSEFAIIHERPVHVFIVSSDLKTFDHVHPEALEPGRWRLHWSAPQGGRYHFFFDVVPAGAMPQLLETVVTLPGAAAAVASATSGEIGAVPQSTTASAPRELVLTSERDGTRVGLEMTDLFAGRWARLSFRLTDVPSGGPASGWEPWLGSWAHLFAIREDATEPQHAHPDADSLVRTADATSVAVDVLFPRAGTYSLWLQLQRAGKVLTLPFKIEVPADTMR